MQYTAETLYIASRTWDVIKVAIDFNGPLFQKAKEQSQLKARYTMPAGQDGQYRSPQMKEQRQLMGTLAEIYVYDWLCMHVNRSADWHFVRYDDVRTDGFKSPENEYDIKIYNPTKDIHFRVECRSSVIHNRSLEDAIRSLNIIGPYISAAKAGEYDSDIYILPLYYFRQYEHIKFLPSAFERHLMECNLQLYLVGGCLNDDMSKRGHPDSLGQSGTQYQVLQIMQGYDLNNLANLISARLSTAASGPHI